MFDASAAGAKEIRKGKQRSVQCTSLHPKRARNGGPSSVIASAAGPSWVAAVVDAIGNSSYWESTAIFISWDDWDYYALGFRVPLVIVSPYARRGYVSHVRHEFGSLVAFSEEAFGIPKGALHATDVRADDLSDAFDFKQTPRPFVTSAPPFVPEHDSAAMRDAEDPSADDGVPTSAKSRISGGR